MKKSGNINYGITFLKVICSVLVVMCHYEMSENTFQYIKSLAVPCFMMLSFFLTGEKIFWGNRDYSKTRIIRLIIPYFFWGGIIGGVLFIGGKVKVQDVFWQLILGSVETVNPPLWYLADLIFLTLLYGILLSRIKNKKYKTIFVIITCAIAIFTQYSGVNYFCFSDLAYEQKYTLGRVMEMIPYAGIGILLAIYMRENFLEKWYVQLVLWMFIIISVHVTQDMPLGFFYQGMQRIESTTLIIVAFIAFPIHMLPSKILILFEELSKYTLGVYCVHWNVGKILLAVNSAIGFELRGKGLALFIYIISFLVIYMLSKIPSKFIKKVIS